MHGGIFHSCCSLTVTLRFGECITGAGGDGGPFGIFLFVLQQAQQPTSKRHTTHHWLYTPTTPLYRLFLQTFLSTYTSTAIQLKTRRLTSTPQRRRECFRHLDGLL